MSLPNSQQSSAIASEPQVRTGDYVAVRLNEPRSGATRAAPLLRFSGAIEVCGSSETPVAEVLLEELNQNTGVIGAASRVVARVASAQHYELRRASGELSSVELIDLRILPTASPGLFEIDGALDVSALLEDQSAAQRMFCLSLLARTSSHVAVSAVSTFSLMPRAAWNNAHGGMNSLSGIRGGEFLEISGWAFKCGDTVQSVGITLNGVEQPGVLTEVATKHVAESLPDFEEAQACGFSVTVPMSNFSSLGPLLHAAAIVRFASGSELALGGGTVTWMGGREKLSGGCSQIESIASNESGDVVISGWIVPELPLLSPPRMFIESNHRWHELGHSAGIGPSGGCAGTVSWMHRDDLDARFPDAMQRLGYGFKAVISPLHIDHAAGALQLWSGGMAHGRGARVPAEQWLRLGEPCDSQKLTSLVQLHLQSPDTVRNVLRQAKGAAKRSLGINARPRLEQPKPADKRAPRKVLLASHNLRATEGAPKVLFEVAAQLLTSRGVQVHVISGEDGELRRQYERLGATVTVIDQFHVAAESWQSFRNGYSAAVNAAADFDPDIVYANGTDAFWGVYLADELGVPVVWGIHESKSPLAWQPQLDTRYRMRFLHALGKVSRLVFVSEATRQLFTLPGAKASAVVIPNGVAVQELAEYAATHTKENLHKVLLIPADTVVVSIVGTTTWRKGQDVFLRAMRVLQDRLPGREFQFLVVGARTLPYLRELKKLTQELSLEEQVVFIEEQPDVRNYFAVSDVLCICSREESAPLVSLEALAMGIPVVSTDVFGLKEQLTDGADSLIVPVEDAQALADSVAKLIETPELGRKLAERGRTTARERFDLDVCTKQHVAVLERVCAGD